jgi:hypothetical protein
VSPPPWLVGTDEGAGPETQEEEEQIYKTKPGGEKKGGMGGLNTLVGIEPAGVNAIGESGEWTEIEFAVDSGATETVMSEEMLTSVETKEGVAAKRGVVYEVANGIRIPNLGEKRFVGVTESGGGREVVAQICDVNKALLSVRRMVAAGNAVVFGPERSYIQNIETGEIMELEEREGMYMVKMWVNNTDARF